MMSALVGAIVVLIVLLTGVWFISSAFRAWAEKPKYTMLERDEMFERAVRSEKGIARTDGDDE
ncbi:hypothetical protein CAP31_10675 [Sulfuriferula sp. AH1]|uniref:hypothetical protein n=1 Tax=Sulfuriferula sp. AH1 TaxID=1985873 RepID=UPI000B3B3AB5|nr:hypothetical protein [Sulfuriferula sp. AH1]ARU32097.1 hypothetical protein CAP31_10675 [Sulfuriferula sp. AH1]